METALHKKAAVWKPAPHLAKHSRRHNKQIINDKFFQAVVISVLLYGCTTWILVRRLENKLDDSCTRMLRAVLKKSWKQHSTRKQLYGHLPPISQTIRVRLTTHTGHCWRSKDKLIRDILLWKPTHGHANVGRPPRIYFDQLCEDAGCCAEDFPGTMNDREGWREIDMDIRASFATS